MRLQPIIEQLGDRGFKTLGGVLEYAALKSAPGRLPAAFAIPETESAAPSRMAGVVDQRVEAGFVVVLMIQPGRDAARSADELAERDVAVKDALVGWRHPDAQSATEYAGGRMIDVDPSAIVWAAQFRTSYHLRKAPA